ncbi:hypothetical protein BGX30_011069, partial [Mortierella sp. GBA39]
MPTVHQVVEEEPLAPDLDPQVTHPTISTDTTAAAVLIGRHPTCPHPTTLQESITLITETRETIIPEEAAMSPTTPIALRHRHQ